MSVCNCPRKEVLPFIQNNGFCHAPIGQIKRLAFSKCYKGAEALPVGFDHTVPRHINLMDSWIDLLEPDSTDNIRLTPIVHGISFEGGDPITYGGGNATFGGIEYIVGGAPVTFKCEFISVPIEIRKAIHEFECWADNLQVFFISALNRVTYRIRQFVDGSGKTHLVDSGIPVSRFSVLDYNFGMLDKPDGFNLSFQMEHDWTSELVFDILDGSFDSLLNQE